MADGHTHITLDLDALVRSTRVWSEHACPSRFVIDPNAFNAARSVLGAEIARVTGAALPVAQIAAGAYLNTPHDPFASLAFTWSGSDQVTAQARIAVEAWQRSLASTARAA